MLMGEQVMLVANLLRQAVEKMQNAWNASALGLPVAVGSEERAVCALCVFSSHASLPHPQCSHMSVAVLWRPPGQD